MLYGERIGGLFCVGLCSYSVCWGGGVRGAFCGAWHSHIVWERKRVGCLLCGACVVVFREIKFEELFMVL